MSLSDVGQRAAMSCEGVLSGDTISGRGLPGEVPGMVTFGADVSL
jgi:hypothetical protein